jgi:hypothetical protein
MCFGALQSVSADYSPDVTAVDEKSLLLLAVKFLTEAVRFNQLNNTIMAAVVNITVHTAVRAAPAMTQPDCKHTASELHLKRKHLLQSVIIACATQLFAVAL